MGYYGTMSDIWCYLERLIMCPESALIRKYPQICGIQVRGAGAVVGMVKGTLAVERATRSDRHETLSFGILSMFDITGLIIYRRLRQRLAVKKPSESATETFRSSAHLISQARNEIVHTRHEVVRASRRASR